jgi:hypothetical protein
VEGDGILTSPACRFDCDLEKVIVLGEDNENALLECRTGLGWLDHSA